MMPWLDFLETDRMQPLTRQYSRLYLKIQWPYLNLDYGPGRRLELLREHYSFFLRRTSFDFRSQLLSAQFLTLARWEIPELGAFSLRLSHENKFSQEGEMVMGLYQDAPERLCALMCFSITGPSEISIGCVQGNRPAAAGLPSNKDFTVALTRKMHGLRPKSLVLAGLRALAADWSLERLRAVGNSRHIFRGNLRSDYDEFWTQAGGVPARDGMYDLPVAAGFRNLEEVSPKKRAMYRRRYQFLATLAKEIAATLADPRRKPTAFSV